MRAFLFGLAAGLLIGLRLFAPKGASDLPKPQAGGLTPAEDMN